MESTNTNWSKTTRYIAGVGLALFGIVILYLSRSVIPSLIVAALIAIIVRPVILWLHGSVHVPRSLSVILVYLFMGILFPLVVILAMPAILDTIRFLASLDYSAILHNVIDWLRSTLSGIKTLPLPIDVLNQYVDQTVDVLLTALNQTTIAQPQPASADAIIQSVTATLSNTFLKAAGVVATLFSSIALILFSFLSSIFISLSAHTFHDSFLRTIPARFRPEVTTLLARIEKTWKAFFRGELTLMVFIGVVVWLGLEILGIPGAPYLGIFAGLLEIVPNFGPVIATIPAVIVALLQGSTHFQVSPVFAALMVILFYYLVQQFENNLIVPKVLGQAVNLPALVVMTGVLVGAEVGGLLGVLLATPVIATIRDITSYIYHKILGENPYPPEEETQTASAHPTNRFWQWVQQLRNSIRLPKQAKPLHRFLGRQQKEDQ